MRCPSPPHRGETARQPTTVDVFLLGGFSVNVDGVFTPAHSWARRSAAALVKILALTPCHRLHRERMMDMLWPDEPVERSAPRLHKAAHFARSAAGHRDAIVLRGDMVWLFPGADITVDAVQFEYLASAALSSADASLARQALGWYGGELLPEDRYEDWAVDRRELLHLRHLDLLRVAGQWRELAELDPTHEEAHVELMREQLAAGDGSAALQQYHRLERVLDRELGVAPSRQARRAWRRGVEAGSSARADQLLAELASLVDRQNAVLAELAGATSAWR